LSRLVVQTSIDTPGLVIKRDGTVVDRPALGIPIPVDPGMHTLSAEAPGHVPWSSAISVTEAGKTITVDVPELSKASIAPSPSPSLTNDRDRRPELFSSYWNGRRIGGAVTAGLGVLAMGVGGALAIVAKSRYDAATGETGAARHEDSLRAVSLGNAATWVIGGGAVVAAAGFLVWLTAPDAHPTGWADGREVLFVRRF
jgi:hypothetical protein